MTTSRLELLTGIRDELPILIGVLPFGMIYGVSALHAKMPSSIAQAMSSIVFAGSSQFVITQLIAAGTPSLVIILTATIINIRHLLYSISLAPHTRHLYPLWKLLLAYLLTDEAYVVTSSHYRQIGNEAHQHWYFLGAGLALWTTWQVSTAIGVFVGGYLPANWSLDFASTLTFLALVIPPLKDRASGAAAISGALVAVLVAAIPLKLGLIIATMSGMLVGFILDSRKRSSSHT